MKIFRKAILIIHGFAGGTYDQEDLATFLEIDGRFEVFTFTLPGHEVKDKRKSTARMWIKESEDQVEKLINGGYKSIYIIGHSMGGVIASYLATKHKEIKKVVLAAPAFTCLACKEEGGIINVIKKSPKLLKAYDWNEFTTRINKLPISATKEFFELIENYKDYVFDIKVPILFIHGNDDKIVPFHMSEKIFKEIKNNKKLLVEVKGCGHGLFKCKKTELANNEVRDFLVTPKLFIKTERKAI